MIKDYNPTGVKQTDFTDPHGNVGYNVFFENEDKPCFMMAKRAPEVGTPEYGEIVDTPKKSGDGTYRKFVRKQREETSSEPSVTPTENTNMVFSNRDSSRDEAITRQSALKSAVAAVGKPEPDQILSLADDFLKWLRNDNTEEVPLPEPQGEKVTIDDGDINLDDIPF